MKTELYKIQTLSNLHVGAGDINFDVIDNQVQRDSITNLPNINSSSLKGAFREYFTEFKIIENEDGSLSKIKLPDSNMVKYIFGPENNSNDSHQTGAYSFFEARLLTRPVRANTKAYFNATCPMVLKNLLETIENFDINFDENLKKELEKLLNIKVEDNNPLIFEKIANTILEDEQATFKNFDTSHLKEFLGENLALFSDKDFKELDLPVIARNKLDNGESKNLWYEEVVPKTSQFYFIIAKPDNIDLKDYDQKIKGFENRFTKEGVRVQIGANRSIGYGFCKVSRVSGE